MGDPWLASSAGGPILAAVLDIMVCNAVGWRCGRARAVSRSYSERWKARQSHQRSLRGSPCERRIRGASPCDASLSLPGERMAFALAGYCRRRSVLAGSAGSEGRASDAASKRRGAMRRRRTVGVRDSDARRRAGSCVSWHEAGGRAAPWTSPGFSQDGSDLGGIARVGRVTSDL